MASSRNDAFTTCPLCGTLASPIAEWAWACPGCGVRFSSLEPRIDEGTDVRIDEDSREAGLRAIRRKGYAIVLDAVGRVRPLAGMRVLDVGSGHGWFLEAAQERGLSAVGVEPDREVGARAASRGLDVRAGYFPEDLPDDERFDLVVFNDVLEHLPDLPTMLGAVHRHLHRGGLMAVSIPTADGLAYKVATGLAKVKVTSPLDRLWQREYPSPHLWYFTEPSLVRSVAPYGFAPLRSGRLPSIERDGLRERIAADPRTGLVPKLAFHTAGLVAPLLNRPRFSDAMWVLFERRDDA